MTEEIKEVEESESDEFLGFLGEIGNMGDSVYIDIRWYADRTEVENLLGNILASMSLAYQNSQSGGQAEDRYVYDHHYEREDMQDAFTILNTVDKAEVIEKYSKAYEEIKIKYPNLAKKAKEKAAEIILKIKQ